MQWLWHNPIADMYGPYFLLFYACVAGLTALACLLAVRRTDWTGALPPPPLPTAPDPYEIAYLRGGENEVARSVIFALIKRDFLRTELRGKKFRMERSGGQPARASLGAFERHAYDWFDRPRTTEEVFQKGGLAERLKALCDPYEQNLRREKLLTPADVRERARLIRTAGLAVVAGLGAYKFLIALSRGRTNVIFLVILGVVAALVLYRICRAPRLSRRGAAHLYRLKTAFDRLRGEAPQEDRKGANAEGESAAGVGALDPTLLTLGVFGATALAGADYDNYSMAFNRTATSQGSGSSCGTGCGSSSSSSSSDGGGSSCSGGSSCGGGGCGGCGGGD